jgi:hypothetical protein
MTPKKVIIASTFASLAIAVTIVMIILIATGVFNSYPKKICPPGGSPVLLEDPQPGLFYNDSGELVQHTPIIPAYLATPPEDPTYTYPDCS